MAYEPTGQAKAFIDAVRREPTRIWTPEEAAILLGCAQSRVGAWLDYAMRQKAIYRGKKGGKVVYSGQPFPPEAAFPTPSERNAATPPLDDIRVPKFTGYVPPQMRAPREGSDVRLPQRAPGTPPAPSGTYSPGPVAAAAPVAAPIVPAPTPGPTAASGPAPAPEDAPSKPALEAADASIPEAAGAEVETEQEDDGPDAFISCRTGQIVLVGIEPDEEGRVTIPADLVTQIKRQLAWSPMR